MDLQNKRVLIKTKLVKINDNKQLVCLVEDEKSVAKLKEFEEHLKKKEKATKLSPVWVHQQSTYVKITLPPYMKTGLALDNFEMMKKKELKMIVRHYEYSDDKVDGFSLIYVDTK